MGQKIFDLSHSITKDIPLYPGTPCPRLDQVSDLDNSGYRELQITYTTHTGTHIDAPAHILKHGKTLDQFPADIFYGIAHCISLSANSTLHITYLERLLKTRSTVDMILFNTGWENHWGTEQYHSNYPVLSTNAISLILELKIKLVGIDALSFDTMDSCELPNHHELLNNNILLIENLKGLAPLAGKQFHLSCAPLPIAGLDGSPVRPLALLNE